MSGFLFVRLSLLYINFKYLVAVILISLYPTAVFSGSSYLPWYRGWEVDISPNSCGLSVHYADKTALLNRNVSEDKYVTFDSFYLRFSIPIEHHAINGEIFSKGSLYLYLISHSGQKLSKNQRGITSVSSLGENFKTYHIDHSPETRIFYLQPADARSVFNSLRRGDKTDLRLTLDDQAFRLLTIKHSERFDIWAEMLQACYVARLSRYEKSDK